ncbi:MAG TPA: MBL fold metallo-hydrolase [Acidimicrobiia bacterium]|jgi:ribonuclease Z
MPTSVVITGTGCPVPAANRAGPGVLIRTPTFALQFDAGRSTVQRLAGAGLWPTRLDAVFLTHHHSDHVVGLADLVLTRWVMDRNDETTPLPIVAPLGAASRFAAQVLEGFGDDIAVRRAHSGRSTAPAVDVVPFTPPVTPTEVWSSADVRVFAAAVRHEPVEGAVGYRVETSDGVVAISGDTRVCDEVAALADGADVLIYEAMRFEPIAELPANRRFVLDYHADTRLIGAQARELGVETLVLTHLLPVPETEADQDAFARDIRDAGYEGRVIVANDLDSVVIG